MGVLEEIEALPLYQRAQKKKRMAADFRDWGYHAEADTWEAEGQREWPDPPSPSAPATPAAAKPARPMPSSKREPGEVDGLREGIRTLRRSAAASIRSVLGSSEERSAGDMETRPEAKPRRKVRPEEIAKIRDFMENNAFSVWMRDAQARAKEQASSPDNLGLLGELGLLTKDEQKAWLAGERIAADRSVVAGRDTLQRADAAAETFTKGAPGKPLHPWIAERQKFGQKAVAHAEERQARVGEMERGERPPARKSAWRALIENSTSGAASGASKTLTATADAFGELTLAALEAQGFPPDTPKLTDPVVQLGDLIADKAAALFPGDPARRDEATQVLAKRAAKVLMTVGGAGAAAHLQGRRRAKRSAKALAGEDK